MKILALSRDQFFLSGLLCAFGNTDVSCSVRNLNDVSISGVKGSGGDYQMVLIDLSLAESTRGNWPKEQPSGNILFISDMNPELIEKNQFVISKRISIDDLRKKIKQNIIQGKPQIRPLAFKNLKLTNSGKNISTIASNLDISKKTVYRQRYNLVRKVGFLRYHPLTAIYSELMIYVLTLQQTNKHRAIREKMRRPIKTKDNIHLRPSPR